MEIYKFFVCVFAFVDLGKCKPDDVNSKEGMGGVVAYVREYHIEIECKHLIM